MNPTFTAFTMENIQSLRRCSRMYRFYQSSLRSINSPTPATPPRPQGHQQTTPTSKQRSGGGVAKVVLLLEQFKEPKMISTPRPCSSLLCVCLLIFAALAAIPTAISNGHRNLLLASNLRPNLTPLHILTNQCPSGIFHRNTCRNDAYDLDSAVSDVPIPDDDSAGKPIDSPPKRRIISTVGGGESTPTPSRQWSLAGRSVFLLAIVSIVGCVCGGALYALALLYDPQRASRYSPWFARHGKTLRNEFERIGLMKARPINPEWFNAPIDKTTSSRKPRREVHSNQASRQPHQNSSRSAASSSSAAQPGLRFRSSSQPIRQPVELRKPVAVTPAPPTATHRRKESTSRSFNADAGSETEIGPVRETMVPPLPSSEQVVKKKRRNNPTSRSLSPSASKSDVSDNEMSVRSPAAEEDLFVPVPPSVTLDAPEPAVGYTAPASEGIVEEDGGGFQTVGSSGTQRKRNPSHNSVARSEHSIPPIERKRRLSNARRNESPAPYGTDSGPRSRRPSTSAVPPVQQPPQQLPTQSLRVRHPSVESWISIASVAAAQQQQPLPTTGFVSHPALSSSSTSLEYSTALFNPTHRPPTPPRVPAWTGNSGVQIVAGASSGPTSAGATSPPQSAGTGSPPALPANRPAESAEAQPLQLPADAPQEPVQKRKKRNRRKHAKDGGAAAAAARQTEEPPSVAKTLSAESNSSDGKRVAKEFGEVTHPGGHIGGRFKKNAHPSSAPPVIGVTPPRFAAHSSGYAQVMETEEEDYDDVTIEIQSGRNGMYPQQQFKPDPFGGGLMLVAPNHQQQQPLYYDPAEQTRRERSTTFSSTYSYPPGAGQSTLSRHNSTASTSSRLSSAAIQPPAGSGSRPSSSMHFGSTPDKVGPSLLRVPSASSLESPPQPIQPQNPQQTPPQWYSPFASGFNLEFSRPGAGGPPYAAASPQKVGGGRRLSMASSYHSVDDGWKWEDGAVTSMMTLRQQQHSPAQSQNMMMAMALAIESERRERELALASASASSAAIPQQNESVAPSNESQPAPNQGSFLRILTRGSGGQPVEETIAAPPSPIESPAVVPESAGGLKKLMSGGFPFMGLGKKSDAKTEKDKLEKDGGKANEDVSADSAGATSPLRIQTTNANANPDWNPSQIDSSTSTTATPPRRPFSFIGRRNTKGVISTSAQGDHEEAPGSAKSTLPSIAPPSFAASTTTSSPSGNAPGPQNENRLSVNSTLHRGRTKSFASSGEGSSIDDEEREKEKEAREVAVVAAAAAGAKTEKDSGSLYKRLFSGKAKKKEEGNTGSGGSWFGGNSHNDKEAESAVVRTPDDVVTLQQLEAHFANVAPQNTNQTPSQGSSEETPAKESSGGSLFSRLMGKGKDGKDSKNGAPALGAIGPPTHANPNNSTSAPREMLGSGGFSGLLAHGRNGSLGSASLGSNGSGSDNESSASGAAAAEAVTREMYAKQELLLQQQSMQLSQLNQALQMQQQELMVMQRRLWMQQQQQQMGGGGRGGSGMAGADIVGMQMQIQQQAAILGMQQQQVAMQMQNVQGAQRQLAIRGMLARDELVGRDALSGLGGGMGMGIGGGGMGMMGSVGSISGVGGFGNAGNSNFYGVGGSSVSRENVGMYQQPPPLQQYGLGGFGPMPRDMGGLHRTGSEGERRRPTSSLYDSDGAGMYEMRRAIGSRTSLGSGGDPEDRKRSAIIPVRESLSGEPPVPPTVNPAASLSRLSLASAKNAVPEKIVEDIEDSSDDEDGAEDNEDKDRETVRKLVGMVTVGDVNFNASSEALMMLKNPQTAPLAKADTSSPTPVKEKDPWLETQATSEVSPLASVRRTQSSHSIFRGEITTVSGAEGSASPTVSDRTLTKRADSVASKEGSGADTTSLHSQRSLLSASLSAAGTKSLAPSTPASPNWDPIPEVNVTVSPAPSLASASRESMNRTSSPPFRSTSPPQFVSPGHLQRPLVPATAPRPEPNVQDADGKERAFRQGGPLGSTYSRSGLSAASVHSAGMSTMSYSSGGGDSESVSSGMTGTSSGRRKKRLAFVGSTKKKEEQRERHQRLRERAAARREGGGNAVWLDLDDDDLIGVPVVVVRSTKSSKASVRSGGSAGSGESRRTMLPSGSVQREQLIIIADDVEPNSSGELSAASPPPSEHGGDEIASVAGRSAASRRKVVRKELSNDLSARYRKLAENLAAASGGGWNASGNRATPSTPEAKLALVRGMRTETRKSLNDLANRQMDPDYVAKTTADDRERDFWEEQFLRQELEGVERKVVEAEMKVNAGASGGPIGWGADPVATPIPSPFTPKKPPVPVSRVQPQPPTAELVVGLRSEEEDDACDSSEDELLSVGDVVVEEMDDDEVQMLQARVSFNKTSRGPAR
ncbi:hypothetical protein BJ742DRAFT_295603 [Cladochytrium replicatum]|nr:hypothetical protein BJ742DRAFT_295603 [Cladochytrium replicatum]